MPLVYLPDNLSFKLILSRLFGFGLVLGTVLRSIILYLPMNIEANCTIRSRYSELLWYTILAGKKKNFGKQGCHI